MRVLIVAVLALAVVHAQPIPCVSLPCTLHVQWTDPNPPTTGVTSYRGYLDSSTTPVFDVAAGSLTVGALAMPFPVSTAGAHTLAVSTVASGGEAVSPALAFAITSTAPLPPPTPGVVNVATVVALQNAVAALTSGTTIVIAAGTYTLTGTLAIPQGLNHVTLKGATGNRDDVVIVGQGMTGSLLFGIWADMLDTLTVQDLTIQQFADHAIILNGGVKSPHLSNLHLRDTGQQLVKGNPIPGIPNGLVEKCLFEWTAPLASVEINALDVHQGTNWIVRGNTFKGVRLVSGLAGPAVLFWNGSSGTQVIGNVFIDNQRDISFGLDPSKPPAGSTDHAGGLIANNMVVRTNQTAVDVPIAVMDSPGTHVEQNTILMQGGYPNAIEYRFPRTTGVVTANNLTDGPITLRDGATATVTNNTTSAPASLFKAPMTGDLHPLMAVPTAPELADVVTDFDGAARHASTSVGAVEFLSSGPPPPPSPPPPAPPPVPPTPTTVPLVCPSLPCQILLSITSSAPPPNPPPGPPPPLPPPLPPGVCPSAVPPGNVMFPDGFEFSFGAISGSGDYAIVMGQAGADLHQLGDGFAVRIDVRGGVVYVTNKAGDVFSATRTGVYVKVPALPACQ